MEYQAELEVNDMSKDTSTNDGKNISSNAVINVKD